MRHRYAAAAKRNANTERWLVSYADYMTLMFALFVVLYAMAITNEKDYPELQQRLQQAIALFEVSDGQAERNETVSSTELLMEYGHSILDGQVIMPNVPPTTSNSVAQSNLTELASQLAIELKDIFKTDDIVINSDEDWLTIELDSRLFFASGSAYLLKPAEQLVLRLSEKLKMVDNYIRVRGYTDEQSIDSELYSSNWELSAARATRVVRELQSDGIQPQRMAIEAYAQYAPLSVNGKLQSDKQNRRVVIALSKYIWDSSIAQSSVVEQAPAGDEQKVVKPDSETMLAVPLEGGGVRFTTRQEE
ncbi:flagellar motor protein MotB [Agarivorans sp. QJM3NY_33]|uniref:flagellar motor protein MotB n=1 Tax=Agarivorans sp. QJM3NY_33 TaxID=3421432 RepID=UPI003D7E6375